MRSNFCCTIHMRSKQGLVVEVSYMIALWLTVVFCSLYEPTPGILGFVPCLLVSSFIFPFLLINSFQRSATVSAAELCGAKPPPALTWSGKRCCPGELLTCEIAKCEAGDGRGPRGAAWPGWPSHREVCARRGWVCNEVALRVPALPKGWFGSLAVPGPWDLPAVPTVPQPAEEVVAVCHAGIPFPRGCQVKAA